MESTIENMNTIELAEYRTRIEARLEGIRAAQKERGYHD